MADVEHRIKAFQYTYKLLCTHRHTWRHSRCEANIGRFGVPGISPRSVLSMIFEDIHKRYLTSFLLAESRTDDKESKYFVCRSASSREGGVGWDG